MGDRYKGKRRSVLWQEIPEPTSAGDRDSPTPPTPLSCDEIVRSLAIPEVEQDIEQLRDRALNRFTHKEYLMAEPILVNLLSQSEAKHGRHFPWRDQTMEMLVTSYWHLNKFEQAEKLLDQPFKGRAKLMEDLAVDSVTAGRRNSTERILSHHFDGRESIMEMYMQTCLNERRWKEAKELLVELLKNETDEKVRVERKQCLARVCFSLGEYSEALAWCLKVLLMIDTQIEDRAAFYESIRLLARIYNAEGTNFQAEGYQATLAELSPGLHGIRLSRLANSRMR